MKTNSLYRLIFAAIIIISFAAFAVGFYNNLNEKSRLKKEKAILENDLEELNSKLEAINYDLENSDSLQFIEKEARALGMIKPGETIIIDMDKEKGGKDENTD